MIFRKNFYLQCKYWLFNFRWWNCPCYDSDDKELDLVCCQFSPCCFPLSFSGFRTRVNNVKYWYKLLYAARCFSLDGISRRKYPLVTFLFQTRFKASCSEVKNISTLSLEFSKSIFPKLYKHFFYNILWTLVMFLFQRY